jgi:hypothetical protein
MLDRDLLLTMVELKRMKMMSLNKRLIIMQQIKKE